MKEKGSHDSTLLQVVGDISVPYTSRAYVSGSLSPQQHGPTSSLGILTSFLSPSRGIGKSKHCHSV